MKQAKCCLQLLVIVSKSTNFVYIKESEVALWQNVIQKTVGINTNAVTALYKVSLLKAKARKIKST